MQDKEMFEQSSQKQLAYSKKMLKIIFYAIGGIFTLLGAILYLLDVKDDNGFAVGIVFLCLGVFFVLLGYLMVKFLPSQYDYDKYKERVSKYGAMNFYDINYQLQIANNKIEQLEQRIQELEDRL